MSRNTSCSSEVFCVLETLSSVAALTHQGYQGSRGEVQHEESLDMAKRIAFRENLRDEWEQLSTKAVTVLIVNTLMLGPYV